MAAIKRKYPVRKVADVPAFLKANNVKCLSELAAIPGKSEKTVKAMLKLALIELDLFLGLKYRLNEQQIDFIAEEIWDEFRGELTMMDWQIIANKFKSGKVELYERLSAPKILSETREYMIDRRDAFEEYNRQHDAQFKSEERQRLQGAADMFRAIGFQQMQKGGQNV